MTTQQPIDLETAVSQVLDRLAKEQSLTLDLSEEAQRVDHVEAILIALHQEARRREMGIAVVEQEGGRLCLSLHRP